jgi:DNA-binding LacI/PurR family transcriptional regulator
MNEILAETAPPPSAVFACNDMTAIGAMDALKKANYSIPGDISVIGLDDIEQSNYYSPKLTTCKVDTALLAKMACQHLFVEIEKDEIYQVKIIIPTEFVIRESTASKKA